MLDSTIPELGEVTYFGGYPDDVCLEHNVTYSHRVNDLENYNWCIVPNTGADAVLYGGVAILFGCIVSGKLSSVWILVAGALFEAVAFRFNLRQLSNATAIWLGMQPPDLFFYVFLPPLLLDAAVRIEFFTFKKVASQIITFAVAGVLGMVALMTPMLLFGLDLGSQGWHWSHAALFVAMIASTDAVAVTAVLTKANGPETLGVLMEGESLFNDATSIVLFEVFRQKVREYEAGTLDDVPFYMQLYEMLSSMTVLALGGAAIGILAGWFTTKIMKFLRMRGMPPPFEVSVTVAVSYLVFYVTNGPLHWSGVIAVVVYGIYGSATLKWDMSATAGQEDFEVFWDVLSQIVNTITFFFSGTACANFFIRATAVLEREDKGLALEIMIWRLPIVYIGMLTCRAINISAWSPFLNLFGATLDWRGIVFVTIGGLRGALCLIMVQTVMLDMALDASGSELTEVKSALATWTAGIVVFTLLINAPSLSFILRVTGLTRVSVLTLQTRDKARKDFLKFSADKVRELQSETDDLLQGVDWTRVKEIVDCSEELRELVAPDGDYNYFEEATGNLQDLDADDAADLIGDSTLMDDKLVDRMRHSLGKSSSGDQSPTRAQVGSYYVSNISAFPLSPPREDSAPLRTCSDIFNQSSKRGSALPDAVPEDNPGRSDATLASIASDATSSRFGGPGGRSTQPADSSGGEKQQGAEEDRGSEVMSHSMDDGAGDSGAGRRHTIAHMHSMSSRQLNASASLRERSEKQLVAAMTPEQIACMNNKERADELKALERKQKEAAAADKAAEVFTLERQGTTTRSCQRQVTGLRGSAVDSVAATEATAHHDEESSAQAHLRFASTDEVMNKPLLESESEGPDDEYGFVTPVRSEPYVVVVDSKAGFMAPSPEHTFNGGAPSNAGSSPRGQHAPFQRPQRTMSQRSAGGGGNMADTVQLHHLSALPPGAMQRLRAEMVSEMRMRIVAGMKRYFHRKRHEGLLSSYGMRMLDNACDMCNDYADEDIDVFSHLHKDFSNGPIMWLFSRLHFQVRSSLINLRGVRPLWVRAMLRAPLQLVNRQLADYLSSRMLYALEASIEYWLAIKNAMSARFLADQETGNPLGHDAEVLNQLKDELQAEKEEVWQFILDRHVEAPDRFRAIQTYRAAMAVMSQQRAYVTKLYNSGILNEQEKNLVYGAIESKERSLREKGAAWDPPSISTSLREIPFFCDISEDYFEEIILQGSLVKYPQGEVMASTAGELDKPEISHIGIIVSGLATTTVAPVASLVPALQNLPAAEQPPETVYLTHGSVFGLMTTVTGREMPGRGDVMAHSGSRGTHVFELRKPVVDWILAQAAEGRQDAQKLARGLFCLTATQILDRFIELFAAVVEHAHAIIARGSSKHGPIHRARWRKAAKSVLGEVYEVKALWAAMRAALQTANVVTLDAGTTVIAQASVVLLSGSITMVNSATGDATASPVAAGKDRISTVIAPCVIVWSTFSKQKSTTLTYRAGGGATLVLCAANQESKLRRQFGATEKVMKNLKIAHGGKRHDAEERELDDGAGVGHSIFSTRDAGHHAAGKLESELERSDQLSS